LNNQPLPNVHWVYFDLPAWARFWKHGRRAVSVYYALWQAGAYRHAARLHRQVQFQIVHHVTFVNYWQPTFLALLPIPFVWGPVGGAESAPHAFYPTFTPGGRMHEHARDAVRRLAGRSPFLRETARRARVSFATTRDTARQLCDLGARSVEIMPESGLAPTEIDFLAALLPHTGQPFRVISLGELLDLKGYHLAMAAFAGFHRRYPSSEYWLVGDGPQRQRLMGLAARLGLGSEVRFWGKVPRIQALEMLGSADVLLHPSLHDSGGWVCVEAMGAGRPIVCLDLGGPGVQVTPETGIKVPAETPRQVVRDLVGALERLSHDDHLRSTMGAAGRARVKTHFSWEEKGRWASALYQLLAA
jgi:glycosyltransferase involved in cell wall biosynthesis